MNSHPTGHGTQVRIAGNTSTGVLKLLALVFMMVDHVGVTLLPGVPEMRMIGRLAFPIYAWCIVAGVAYTRNRLKYLLRLLLTGLLCQLPYLIALNHYKGPLSAMTLNDFISTPNVFLTLSLGMAAIWGVDEKKYLSHIWAPAAALLLAQVTGCDYGWRGVMLILLLYLVRDSRRGIAAVMIAFCMFWGSFSFPVSTFLGLPVNTGKWPSAISSLLSPMLRLQAMAVFSLPFILIPFRSNWKMPRWLSYSLYPAHLLVLLLLEKIF